MTIPQAAGKATPASAEAKQKSQKDAQAYICAVCRTAFPINVKAAALAEHAAYKHAKLPETQCWPAITEMRAKEAEGKK